MKKIKEIIQLMEKIFTHPIGALILVTIMVTHVVLLYLKLMKIIDFSIGEYLTIMFLFIIGIPCLIFSINSFFYLKDYINDYLFDISCKFESFSLFMSRRNLSFLKAFIFTIKSQTVRRVSITYRKQKIKTENKYFRKYRGKNKKFINQGLLQACRKGDLDGVEYLLLSSELKENADIEFEGDYHNDNAFALACKGGHLEIIQYLLFSKKLKKNTNLEKFGDSAFSEAFYNNKINILKYLVFEANIPKTDYLKNFIAERPPTRFYDMDNLFKTRDLNNELKANLFINSEKQKRMKI